MAPRKMAKQPAKTSTAAKSTIARTTKGNSKTIESAQALARGTPGSKRNGAASKGKAAVPATPVPRGNPHKLARQQSSVSIDAALPAIFRPAETPSSPSAKPIDHDTDKTSSNLISETCAPAKKAAPVSDVPIALTSTLAPVPTQNQNHAPPSAPISIDMGKDELRVQPRGDVTPTPEVLSEKISKENSSNHPQKTIVDTIDDAKGISKSIDQSIEMSDDDDCLPLNDLDARFS
jgi:hypothetical protein